MVKRCYFSKYGDPNQKGRGVTVRNKTFEKDVLFSNVLFTTFDPFHLSVWYQI